MSKNVKYNAYAGQPVQSLQRVDSQESITSAMNILNYHKSQMPDATYQWVYRQIKSQNKAVIVKVRAYFDHNSDKQLTRVCQQMYEASLQGRTPSSSPDRQQPIRSSLKAELLSNEKNKSSKAGRTTPDKFSSYNQPPMKSPARAGSKSAGGTRGQKTTKTNSSPPRTSANVGEKSINDYLQLLGIKPSFDDLQALQKQIPSYGRVALPSFDRIFVEAFPDCQRYGRYSKEGRRVLDETISNIFELLDTNCDGLITKQDIEAGFENSLVSIVNQGQMGVEEIFEEINDGRNLTSQSVESWATGILKGFKSELTAGEMAQDFVQWLFEKADMDQNGTIHFNELKMWSQLEPKQFATLADLASQRKDLLKLHPTVFLKNVVPKRSVTPSTKKSLTNEQVTLQKTDQKHSPVKSKNTNGKSRTINVVMQKESSPQRVSSKELDTESRTAILAAEIKTQFKKGLDQIAAKYDKLGFEETERLAEDLNRRVSYEIDKLPDQAQANKLRPQVRKIRSAYDQKMDQLLKEAGIFSVKSSPDKQKDLIKIQQSLRGKLNQAIVQEMNNIARDREAKEDTAAAYDAQEAQKRKERKQQVKRKQAQDDLNTSYFSDNLVNPHKAQSSALGHRKDSSSPNKLEDRSPSKDLSVKSVNSQTSQLSFNNLKRKKTIKQDLDHIEIFQNDQFKTLKMKISHLQKTSRMIALNAKDVARDMHDKCKILVSGGDYGQMTSNLNSVNRKNEGQTDFDKISIDFEDFKRFFSHHLEKPASKTQQKVQERALKAIFDHADSTTPEEKGKIDKRELGLTITLMCGGSFRDKLEAGFLIFDHDYSNLLSHGELIDMISVVFSQFQTMLGDISENQDKDECMKNLDFDMIAQATADKCFSDMKIAQTQEINYQQFYNWLNGNSFFSSAELKALEDTKPPKKAESGKNKYLTKKEWITKFIQDEPFMPVIEKLRQNTMLGNVPIQAALHAIQNFSKKGMVPRKNFMDIMHKLVRQWNKNITADQDETVNKYLGDLFKFIDENNNNVVEPKELVGALMIICKHSVEGAIQAGIFVFGDEGSNCLQYDQLKEMIQTVFTLFLDTPDFNYLDYPLKKLGGEVAQQAFEMYKADLDTGAITEQQIIKFFIGEGEADEVHHNLMKGEKWILNAASSTFLDLPNVGMPSI